MAFHCGGGGGGTVAQPTNTTANEKNKTTINIHFREHIDTINYMKKMKKESNTRITFNRLNLEGIRLEK